MAIIKKFYLTREDGVNLYKTYSDLNLKIQKVNTDEIYDEAIDVEFTTYRYEETQEPIENIDNTEIIEKAMAYDILVGEAQ